MAHPIDHIVIVGGGTAGWLAAVYLNHFLQRSLQHCAITVIESSDIGTIGVGEGTIHTFGHTMRSLQCREAEWMVHRNASFKLGTKFVDWLVGNDTYWFVFESSYSEQYPLVEYCLLRERGGQARQKGAYQEALRYLKESLALDAQAAVLSPDYHPAASVDPDSTVADSE